LPIFGIHDISIWIGRSGQRWAVRLISGALSAIAASRTSDNSTLLMAQRALDLAGMRPRWTQPAMNVFFDQSSKALSLSVSVTVGAITPRRHSS
jgi:hypothetical protein